MHLNVNLSKKILGWYDNNKRSLPWRVGKKSPKRLYYRLLSEFMLQQTQVKTVIPYFVKFTKKYKSLKSFSKSNEKNTLKLWEGLGYYRRARNLLATSKILVLRHKSKLPRTFKEIKTLPGIGDYTANALLGLVHDQPVIAIDGNVKRVFSRILNKNENRINFVQFIKINEKKLFSSKRNSDFVEALMEFGALVCRPKDPKCNFCNLNNSCKYFNSSKKIKNKKKQIALTKKNNLGFLNEFSLPEVRETNENIKNKNWKFLKNYKNTISNKKMNINLYYKFSNKIPSSFMWHSIDNKKIFIPSFTKKIFRQVSILF